MNFLNEGSRKGLYVIRFLNTDLAGCEYLITESLTHFIANSAEDLRRRQELLISADYVFVPDESIQTSFDIESENEEAEPWLIVPHSGESRPLHWHAVHSVEGVYFALKQHADQVWSKEIQQFNVAGSGPDDGEEPMPEKRQWHIPSLVAIILAILLVAFAGYQYYSEQLRHNDLSHILGGETRDYQISKGRDGWYVFANDTGKRDWARRALIRAGEAQNTVVITKSDESARIAYLIGELRPDVKFHVIRMDNPFLPEIVLSKERGGLKNDADYNVFRELLLSKMMYASGITFSHLSDRVVASQAEQAMRKTAATFSREQNADSVTFIARGALDDNELNQLKTTVQQFNQRWQGNYIRFAVELENDWLKGKSYQYGADGYIKMNPKHWYFPLDIRNIK